MEKYDYRKAVYSDVLNYIRWNFSATEIENVRKNPCAFAQTIAEEAASCDGVTGGETGHYWESPASARAAISQNIPLLSEAVRGSGYTLEEILEAPSEADYMIRCHLLDDAIESALMAE